MIMEQHVGKKKSGWHEWVCFQRLGKDDPLKRLTWRSEDKVSTPAQVGDVVTFTLVRIEEYDWPKRVRRNRS